MFFLELYYHTVIQYDLINLFLYKTLQQVPKLKNITLNFGYQKTNLKYLISGLLALEHLSLRKSKLTKSKRLNIFLKIKKGNPVGCKIRITKNIMYLLYFKLRLLIFEKIKHPLIDKAHYNLKAINSLSIRLKTPLVFVELESQYQFFKNLPSLGITISSNAKSQNEFFFFLQLMKFFL